MLGLGGSAGAASTGGAGGGAPGASVDLSSLPIRAFLDQSVVPVLLQALCALVRERCVAGEARGLRSARARARICATALARSSLPRCQAAQPRRVACALASRA
jgi:hypothetical protein